MKKQILFLICIHSYLASQAQNKDDHILINQTFTATIGYVCEETPEPNPCAGLEIYLVLSFTKEEVSIIEKEVSSCDVEDITSKLNYKWELIQDSEIKIYSNPKEIEYNFLEGLRIKIEDNNIIGYKKTDRIEFKKML